MSFRVTFGSATHVGMVREGNEDSLLVRPPLYVVADGMGGHLGGEVASALAIETLAAHVDRKGPEALVDGVTEANLAVYEKQKLDASLAGMGTTLTAALIDDEGLHLAHVGDSRGYLIRGDEFRMITDDHTMVGELVRAKRLTPDEARVHPQRSMLTRALGIDSGVEVDTDLVPLEDGDRIVLCSDGLNAILTETRIEEIARAGAPTETAHALVDAANDAGGIDNTTVIVLDISTSVGGGGAILPTMLPPVMAGSQDAATSPEGTRADKVVLAKPGQRDTTPRRSATDEPMPFWRSRLVIGATVALLVVLAVVPIYASSNTYVGIHDGQVAIFHGLPASLFGIPLHSVHEVTDLDAEEVMETGALVAAGLEDGISVADDEEAQILVAQLREALEQPPLGSVSVPITPPAPSPAPTLTPSPSPSPLFGVPSPTTSPSPPPPGGFPAPAAPLVPGVSPSSPSTSPSPVGVVP